VSRIVDESLVLAGYNCTTPRRVTLDLGETDLLSVGVTIVAFTGINVFTLLESVDGTNFVVVATINEHEVGTTIWHVGPVFSRWKRIQFTPDGTGGNSTFTVTINAHNNTVVSTGSTVPSKVEFL
jgi:hypothetical protein